MNVSNTELPLDSRSEGDPSRFVDLDALVSRLRALPPAPADRGMLVSAVVRSDGGRRLAPARVRLSAVTGVEGDAWTRADDPNPLGQITVMQADVAALIANGQSLALFGDNLFLDLDISAANLPVGSRLRVGEAVVEVTPKPHNGCVKFRGRFGADALRFVSLPELRARNLRGIYVSVLEDGETGPGDPVDVISR